MNLFSFNEVQVSYTCKQVGPAITQSRDAWELLSPNWLDMDYCESFYVILLNRGNKVLGVCKISTGSVSGTVADPKKIFQTALAANASAVILAHNHPSGNLKPSNPDRRLTEKVKQSGILLDLPIMDHLIITRKGFFSFADEGLL